MSVRPLELPTRPLELLLEVLPLLELLLGAGALLLPLLLLPELMLPPLTLGLTVALGATSLPFAGGLLTSGWVAG